MAAAFSELHDDVEDGRPVLRLVSGEGIEVAKEQLLVQLFLHLGHSHHHDGFRLRWETLRDVGLEAPEHEGPQDLVQLRDHVLLGFFVVDFEVEPFVELLGGGEDVGEQEVQQGPQLVEVVLEGRSREEQPIGGPEAPDRGAEHAGVVLEPMGFVDHQVLPGELSEGLALRVAHLVSRHADVPLSGVFGVVVDELPVLVHHLLVGSLPVVRGRLGVKVFLDHVLAVFPGSVEADGTQARTPPLQLVHPVGKGGFRDANEMGALDA
mmetsp:Transcript_5634/g.14077  ORF Transcript_5634/g.14077 Transcript_5634/m.14077 type:complete len:265 (-) Transcript_5634:1604-2398(-)